MKSGRFFAYNYDTGNDPYSNINLYNVPRTLPIGGVDSTSFGSPNQLIDGLTTFEKVGIVAITLLVFNKIM